MVIHASLSWPEVSSKDSRPLELNYATYLHNITRRQDNGESLDEIWLGAVFNHEKLGSTKTGYVQLIS